MTLYVNTMVSAETNTVADAFATPHLQMAHTDLLVAEATPAPSHRVEAWVQYYEYFNRLNEDMQVINVLACANTSAC